MSEIINVRMDGTYRLKLLAGVSALVLIACVYSETEARAADSDRPTVWIEGGWHFDSITGRSDMFVPPLNSLTVAGGFPSVTRIENTLGRSSGAEGGISFQPKESDWVFSVSARYGRTHSVRKLHQESDIVGSPMKKTVENASFAFVNVPYTPVFAGYVEQSTDNSEAHTIVDFQIGKDVGVGLLGRNTDSVISFGARYAQFNVRSQTVAHAEPDATFEQFTTPGFLFHPKYQIRTYNHGSAALAERYSDLRALGPSISLNNTTALLGDRAEGQLALDWGVNAAVLFGRQRAKVHHQSTTRKMSGSYVESSAVIPPVTSTRTRHVTIPNLGGFAGLSYRFPNAKLSAGYRADFFFGAMEAGLDSRHDQTVGFHGPFATLSIGLGG